MLHAAQIPASLRAVDAIITEEIHDDTARDVGSRVCGHPGGLSVKERYLLAEKREEFLRKTRKESIRQREKQRSLRGAAIAVKKQARRMAVKASSSCAIREDREPTEAPKGVGANIEGVRAAIQRIEHIISMARKRSELRAVIRDLSGKYRTKSALKRNWMDCEKKSPRERYLERRAATLLQRFSRGFLVRNLIGRLTPTVLQFHVESDPQRYTSGCFGRRAMLLARFRRIHAAYEELLIIAPFPGASKLRLVPESGIHTVHPKRAVIPAHSGMMMSIKSRRVFVESNSLSNVMESSTRGGKALDPVSREERIVLWALEDIATRIIQHEIRHHSRRSFARRQESEGTPGVAPANGCASVPPAERMLLLKPNEQDTAFSDGDKGQQCGGNKRSDYIDDGGEQCPRTGTAHRARRDQPKSRERGFMTSIPMSGLGLRSPNQTHRPSVSTSGATALPTIAVRVDDVPSESPVEAALSSDLLYPDVKSTSGSQDPCKTKGVVDSSTAAAFPSAVEAFVCDNPILSSNGRTSERGKERLVAGAGCEQQSGWSFKTRRILLPAEEQKKRRNEKHLRRNKSLAAHARRRVVRPNCLSLLDLPEIIRVQAYSLPLTSRLSAPLNRTAQRVFRSRRARRVRQQWAAVLQKQQSSWKTHVLQERLETANRWKSAMSRLLMGDPSARMLDEKAGGNTTRRGGDAFRKSSSSGEGARDSATEHLCKKARVFPGDATRDLRYANAQWSLAIAYNLRSWAGGPRKRYFFGRFKAFLRHRQRRKAALTSSVETRMAKRLQTWAAELSVEKRSIARDIKARAPPDIVGAHLRFLSRTGTWRDLLIDLGLLIASAQADRERAVELLKEAFIQQTLPLTERPPLQSSTPLFAPLPEYETLVSPDNLHNYSMNHQAGRNARSDRWACGVSSKPCIAPRRVKGVQPLGLAGGGGVRREDPRKGVLRPARDQKTKGLHPWLVIILARSNIQSIPSVPFCHRVGRQVLDTEDAEIRAETQLTRRYWRFLEGVSGAVLLLGASKVEAATLAAEAGEWRLLLGFARHLVSVGSLLPPQALPNLPRRAWRSGALPAPGQGRYVPKSNPRRPDKETTPVLSLRNKEGWGNEKLGYLVDSTDSKNVNRADKSAPRWFDSDKDLCSGCWAMRVNAGLECQRCGRRRRKGFEEAGGGRGEEQDGPVSWKAFRKVGVPLDLFIVHAAYSCILHPGCSTREPRLGNGWWDGGSPEEAWWRAVCGGKQAATSLKRHGCDTIGKLYTITCDISRRTSSVGGKQRQSDAAAEMTRPVGKLGRWLGDEDLADKIPSLLFRLMFAFEELRGHRPWPTPSREAVENACRPLHPF